MKNIFSFLIFSILLSSCSSTYFFTTLNTTSQYVEKVENGDFLLQTDSLWIAHCFKGQNAPVQITIFNKLNEPLYIDWSRSAIIIDGVAHTYTGDELESSAVAKRFSNAYSAGANELYTYSPKDYNEGKVVLPSHISFVPPNSMVSEIPLNINPNFEHLKKYRTATFVDKDNNPIKIKRLDCDQSTSPLVFKSYLTIFYKPQKPIVFEQEFYASTLIRTSRMKPTDLPNEFTDRGDFFYIEKPANNTAFYTILGITGTVITIILGGDVNAEDYSQ